MRRRSLVGAAALVALGLFAVPPDPAASAAASPLRARLLRADQLPAGWRAQASSGVAGPATGCLSPRRVLPPPAATASALFSHGGVPQVLESLSSYRSFGARAFAEAVVRLDACHAVRVAASRAPVTVHVRRISFPRLGDQSAAYALSFPPSGIFSVADFLVVRRGDLALVLIEMGVDATALRHFARFAARAVADLS